MGQKQVTEKGKAVGISVEIKMSQAGNEYSVLMYNEEAQRMVVKKLKEEWLV